MTTWDIPEPQVAIDFPDDANFGYHVRFLFVRLSEPGKWIAGSCDWDLEVVDLTQHHVVSLPRAGEIPQRLRGNVYYRGVLDEQRLSTARAEAASLAQVLGAAVAGGGGVAADWLFADTAHEQFGEPVPPDVVRNPARMTIQGALAMVDMGDDGWTFAERVMAADKDAWLHEKRNGPGRDARVLPLCRDARGHRFVTLREAMQHMRQLSSPPPSDWPFKGPAALWEVLCSARAAGEDLGTYHDYYLRTSGLDGSHPVAIKHRELFSILKHLICFDQADAPQLASAELVARLILQIHQAVRRSPKAPDFRGTQLMIMSQLDSSGGILTGDFAKFVAEEQKSEAFTVKQQRLFAEEEEKRKGQKGPPGDSGGGKK